MFVTKKNYTKEIIVSIAEIALFIIPLLFGGEIAVKLSLDENTGAIGPVGTVISFVIPTMVALFAFFFNDKILDFCQIIKIADLTKINDDELKKYKMLLQKRYFYEGVGATGGMGGKQKTSFSLELSQEIKKCEDEILERSAKREYIFHPPFIECTEIDEKNFPYKYKLTVCQYVENKESKEINKKELAFDYARTEEEKTAKEKELLFLYTDKILEKK